MWFLHLQCQAYVRKCIFIIGFSTWIHWRHTAPFWKEILAKYSSVGEEEEEKEKKKNAHFHREFILNDKTIHHTLLLWIFSGWLPPKIQSAPFYFFFISPSHPQLPWKPTAAFAADQAENSIEGLWWIMTPCLSGVSVTDDLSIFRDSPPGTGAAAALRCF